MPHVAHNPFMLSVIMPSVVMPRVVALKNQFRFPAKFLSNIDEIKWLSERANLHVSMTVAFGLAFFRSIKLL
jgi:hypothetical protein